jgi:hypothetical protein
LTLNAGIIDPDGILNASTTVPRRKSTIMTKEMRLFPPATISAFDQLELRDDDEDEVACEGSFIALPAQGSS